jgi:hypothetical protein
MQCGADGFGGRQPGLRGALLGHQLAPPLGRGQSRIQAGSAELGLSLAWALDEGLDSRQEVGKMSFRALPPTQGKGIATAHAAVECVQALTNGHAPPPQFAGGALLPAWPQCFDGACHKQAPGAALERLCGRDQQCLERVGQCHWYTSSMRMPGV